MGRHRHAINVRADGLAAVLGPLLRDPRIRVATLVDVDSGMVLDACGAAPDLEVLGASQAELVRIALGLLAAPTCEVVVEAGGERHHIVRVVPDPHGGRLALSVVVDGSRRAVERTRRRLREVSDAALTAGPTMSRRPVVGGPLSGGWIGGPLLSGPTHPAFPPGPPWAPPAVAPAGFAGPPPSFPAPVGAGQPPGPGMSVPGPDGAPPAAPAGPGVPPGPTAPPRSSRGADPALSGLGPVGGARPGPSLAALGSAALDAVSPAGPPAREPAPGVTALRRPSPRPRPPAPPSALPPAPRPTDRGPAAPNSARPNPAMTHPVTGPFAVPDPGVSNPALMTHSGTSDSATANLAETNAAMTNAAMTNSAMTNPAMTNPAANPVTGHPAMGYAATADRQPGNAVPLNVVPGNPVPWNAVETNPAMVSPLSNALVAPPVAVDPGSPVAGAEPAPPGR